jgi:lysophospholipase L1-like esterase
MKTFTRTLCLLSLFIALAAAAFAQGDFYLKPGDRVVFYGDSITDQRLYTTFAETFVVTRFPNMKVSFVHSGWGGDRVTGGGGGPIDMRLSRDVIPYKPTVMTVMLGMNDASYRAFDQNIFNTYSTGYEHIVQSVKSSLPGIRMTLIQPSPYDDVTRAPGFEGGYNATLLRYSDYVKELATKNGLQVADLNNPVVAALKTANETDHATALKIVPDRVHPGPGGHLLMAEALLKAWNAPAIVTSVELDATAKKVTNTNRTRVSGVQWGNTVSWDQLDSALPMPVDMNDPVVALSVRSSDFVQALDQQPLKVTGLTGGSYTLKIDGAAVGTFSGSELASGVNLALLPTPMAKQAAAVHALTLKHNNIHFIRWRNVQVPMQADNLPSMPKAMAGLDAIEGDIIAQQRAAAKPITHHYEITP